MQAGIFSGSGGDLCGKKIHDRSVFVGGPYGAVAAQEARTRALLSTETHGTIDQAGYKPLEAHWHFVQLTSELLHDAIDHAAAYQRFPDGGVGVPLRPILQQVMDRYRQEVVRVHQAGGWSHNAMTVGVGVVGEGHLV